MRIDPETLCLDLNSIRSSSCSESVRLLMAGVEWDLQDIRPASPEGVLELTVTAKGSTWICSGNLSAEFEIHCSRCLEPARFPVDAEVYRIFTWDEELATDLETELIQRNEGAVSILDAVREAVILSVPGMPLCRADCRGICPECGENLNHTDCKHSRIGGTCADPVERE